MKDNYVYLKHILEAIGKIERYLSDMDYEAFASNDMAIDAVVRELEIIGEAANNIEDKFQKDNPEIPWRKIVGMRNNLIHEYFGVDKLVVWDTCKKNLPALKEVVFSAIQ